MSDNILMRSFLGSGARQRTNPVIKADCTALTQREYDRTMEKFYDLKREVLSYEAQDEQARQFFAERGIRWHGDTVVAINELLDRQKTSKPASPADLRRNETIANILREQGIPVDTEKTTCDAQHLFAEDIETGIAQQCCLSPKHAGIRHVARDGRWWEIR